MESILGIIQTVCGRIQIVSDLLWDFPTNLEWYAGIPVVGEFSLAVILLIGSGIYFGAGLSAFAISTDRRRATQCRT